MNITINPTSANKQTVKNPNVIHMFIALCDGQIETPVIYMLKRDGDTVHASITINGIHSTSGMATIPVHGDYYIVRDYPLQMVMRAAGCEFAADDYTDMQDAFASISAHAIPGAKWGAGTVKTILLNQESAKPFDPANPFGVSADDDE